MPEHIETQGKWKVALAESIHISHFKGKKSPNFLLVYSDVYEDAVINGSKLPLLQHIFSSDHKGELEQKILKNLNYTNVRVNQISRLEIYIKTEENEYCPFKCLCGVHNISKGYRNIKGWFNLYL